ncbi:putative ABC transport system permease protein [Acetitomaculum ruminis DSM 5522]|uniref:Putative ABC transport system permease protein n=1 Tax=Acetitomaculum ruminis DSM 5522 TaxID=1120918 RepID=A0A1I0ZUU0_9FIRM|nr:ABC transporter permease [Acetitomaculum ruminis]SFB28210.1 putative ABC transport system permease protein [Acetitomaculum ruminis DSM 5522]
MFITPAIIQTALEVGLIYSLVALSLYLSFSILNLCDLSTDGCYTLGCAVGAITTMAGHPILAIPLAMIAGVCSGFITAFLQTRLNVESILAGIIVNTGLYTINLFVMGLSSNISIFGVDTVFSLFKGISDSPFWTEWHKLILLFIIVLISCLSMAFFLGTRLGLSIRATGDNEAMVKSSSINTAGTITVGLCVANSFTALAGCLIGQYNKSCDINLGTGMVTIALASLVIGETIFGRYSVKKGIVGVVCGSCLYRFIVAMALRLNVPTEAFKLVSAIIIAVAIAAPRCKEYFLLQKAKTEAKKAHEAENKALGRAK